MRTNLIEGKNKLSRNIRKTTKISIDRDYRDKLIKFKSQTRHATKKTFVLSKDISEEINRRNEIDNVNINNIHRRQNNVNVMLENNQVDIEMAKLRELIMTSADDMDENSYLIYNLSENKNIFIDDAIEMLFQEFNIESIRRMNYDELKNICKLSLQGSIAKERC